MYSLSLDYVFNRVYDFLLWMKYVWLFVFFRKDKETYLIEHQNISWDGLRDRGWFDSYFASRDVVVPDVETRTSLWHRLLEKFGFKLSDSDGDGVPDISDKSPYDANNLTSLQLKERYQQDYSFFDHVRDLFGMSPKDSDGDGVPDSYELSHGMDPKNGDGDRDGLPDSQEIALGTDPFNNDTDRDLVLDGRDEYPLDGGRSFSSMDSDGDGISNRVEEILGTNSFNKDTDRDGIADNMDTYSLDPNNVSQVTPFDFSKSGDGETLYFSIQNPVLSLISDFMSVVAIVFIVIMVYASIRWLISYLNFFEKYEEHFKYVNNNNIHVIKDNGHVIHNILNLSTKEETPSFPPSQIDFKEHPKFAIIKGYLSGNSEALWRIGIMEADNLLLETLKEKGYQGENVSDLLKNASFKTTELAWDAHKIRNRIAHEGSDFQLTEREAKRAFNLYESVFRELKVI